MSEGRVAEFVRRAEAAVEVPDLTEIRARGRGRRRRDRVLAAAVASVSVGLGAWAVGGLERDADVRPVDPPGSGAPPYPGSSDAQRLEPGVYALELDRETSPATVLFEVPEGWRSWYGPNLPQLRSGYAGMLVGDVERVAADACRGPVSVMTEAGQSASRLVAALELLPRHELVSPPSATTVDGLPATHLTLRLVGRAGCPGGGAFEIWDSPGAGGLIQSAPAGSVLDLWVVDVDGEALLVAAVTGRRTPAWARDELEAVVASVEVERP